MTPNKLCCLLNPHYICHPCKTHRCLPCFREEEAHWESLENYVHRCIKTNKIVKDATTGPTWHYYEK